MEEICCISWDRFPSQLTSQRQRGESFDSDNRKNLKIFAARGNKGHPTMLGYLYHKTMCYLVLQKNHSNEQWIIVS